LPLSLVATVGGRRGRRTVLTVGPAEERISHLNLISSFALKGEKRLPTWGQRHGQNSLRIFCQGMLRSAWIEKLLYIYFQTEKIIPLWFESKVYTNHALMQCLFVFKSYYGDATIILCSSLQLYYALDFFSVPLPLRLSIFSNSA